MLRAPIAVLVLAAALVASGCGGDGEGGGSGASPEQYAADVCGAITAWQKELQTSASTMSSTMSASSSLEEVKSKLVEFMQAAVTSTESMIAKVKAAGPPAIDNGAELQRDLEAGLTKAKDAFAQARDEAKKLPTDNPTAFQTGATALGTTLDLQGNAIEATFKGLGTKHDSADLNEAFDKEPACTAL